MLFFFLSTLISFNPNLIPTIISSLPNSNTNAEISTDLEINYDYEPTKTLAADLRKGGYVIFFRHTATDQQQKDRDLDFADCDTQRNLNQKGREEAQAIGASFKRLNVPVGKVLASPFCRTLETAEIAFDKSAISQGLVSITYARTQTPELVKAVVKKIRTPPLDATNTILVGHGVNLNVALELELKEGGAAIFKPKANRNFALVAQIQEVQEWEAQVGIK